MHLNRIGWALVLFITSICIGMIGYVYIENFSFTNALYMTIITISTVGFTEVGELSEQGRIFTSVYIIFNLAIYAYAVTVITQYLFEGEVKNKFEAIRKDKRIRKMNDHVIVCGFGRNGSKATEELLKNKIPVVVIENIENSSRKNDPIFKDAVFLAGDATTDDLLVRAGIRKAKAIISSLPSDADNVFITLTAREMNPNVSIIARASYPKSELKLKRAGANYVVMPDYIGGLHMAGLLLQKEQPNYSQTLTAQNMHSFNMQEIEFSKLGDSFKGKRFSEINTALKGAMLVGYKNKEGQLVVNPVNDICFAPEDTVLLVSGDDAPLLPGY